VSSGLEPAFAAEFRRSMLHEDGTTSAFELVDYAVALWRRLTGDRKGLPPAFVRASDVPPDGHVAMQAALQPFVDYSISKTIAVPEDFPFDAFQNIYDLAYDRRLKGCTTYRPNPVRGVVVTAAEESTAAPPLLRDRARSGLKARAAGRAPVGRLRVPIPPDRP